MYRKPAHGADISAKASTQTRAFTDIKKKKKTADVAYSLIKGQDKNASVQTVNASRFDLGTLIHHYY